MNSQILDFNKRKLSSKYLILNNLKIKMDLSPRTYYSNSNRILSDYWIITSSE
jgi:hypothetical protein